MTTLGRLVLSLCRLRAARFFAAFAGLCCLAARSKTVEWKEEVQLNDGRMIVVEQKRRCEGGNYTAARDATCIAREAWLTIQLNALSSDPIIWHESLTPMVLGIDRGKLYVVAFPPHTLEFRKYGATNPPYFGFIWEKIHWKRISLFDVPTNLYSTNF